MRIVHGYYILQGHEPVPAPELLKWAEWFETADSGVAKTELGDGAYLVSTVFLGLDHRHWGEGPPILFESMVFDKAGHEVEGYTERYCTWDEAEAGHAQIVAQLRAKLREEMARAIRAFFEEGSDE